MDFLDSLRNIKKEMQSKSSTIKSTKRLNKNSTKIKVLEKQAKDVSIKVQEVKIDKQMQDFFLKEEKLRDEFAEFIKNTDIKKI